MNEKIERKSANIIKDIEYDLRNLTQEEAEILLTKVNTYILRKLIFINNKRIIIDKAIT